MAGRALAHADYERSEPAAGAVVNEAPARVDVWFSQEMFRREGANTLEVLAPGGETVHAAAAVLDDADRSHLSVELEGELAPGEYEVRWTTLSAIDGDDASGSFTFTFDPDATPTSGTPNAEETPAPAEATAPPRSAPTSDLLDGGSSFPWWAVIGGAVVALTGALGAWALLAGPAPPEGG